MTAFKRIYVDITPEVHSAAQAAARALNMPMKAYIERLITTAAGNAAVADKKRGK